MKKLNFKKLTTLAKGKYHDGDGLYITLTSPGKGKWSFRYRFNKKPVIKPIARAIPRLTNVSFDSLTFSVIRSGLSFSLIFDYTLLNNHSILLMKFYLI